MSDADPAARAIQAATGARYVVCLTLARKLRMSNKLASYLDRLRALPSLRPGLERCLVCLRDRHVGACAP